MAWKFINSNIYCKEAPFRHVQIFKYIFLMWQLIPKCFPKMGAPAQPLLGQTEPIWCAQLPGQLQNLHSLECLSSEQLPALPRRCCNTWTATFHLRIEACALLCPSKWNICSVLLMIYSSRTGQEKGREPSSGLVARGNGGGKGIAGEAENEWPVLLGSL